MGEILSEIQKYYSKLETDLVSLYRESDWEKGVDIVIERVERCKEEALIMVQIIENLGLSISAKEFMENFIQLQTTTSQQRVDKTFKEYRNSNWKEPYGKIRDAEQRILNFNENYKLDL